MYRTLVAVVFGELPRALLHFLHSMLAALCCVAQPSSVQVNPPHPLKSACCDVAYVWCVHIHHGGLHPEGMRRLSWQAELSFFRGEGAKRQSDTRSLKPVPQFRTKLDRNYIRPFSHTLFSAFRYAEVVPQVSCNSLCIVRSLLQNPGALM